jgi:hypothetical protein
MITTTLFFATLLFVSALIILTPNFKLAWNALNSYKWKAIEGTIINRQLEVIKDNELEEFTHRFNVTYEYSVDNQVYQSHRLYFGDNNYRGGDGSKGFLANLNHQLKPNSPITAFYNPKQPSSAVLYKGFQTDTKILIISSILILVSTFLLVTKC